MASSTVEDSRSTKDAVAVVGVGEALESDLRQLQPREAAVGPVEHVDPDLLLHHVDLVAEVLLGDAGAAIRSASRKSARSRASAGSASK